MPELSIQGAAVTISGLTVTSAVDGYYTISGVTLARAARLEIPTLTGSRILLAVLA